MNKTELVQKEFPFDFDTSLMTADRYKSIENHPLGKINKTQKIFNFLSVFPKTHVIPPKN